MEDKVINHLCHEHPLILTENVGNEETLCYGCRKPVVLESAYVCSQRYCPGNPILHKKCAEIPRQILLPSHPHPLHLFDYQRSGLLCCLCFDITEDAIGYRCAICDFDTEISCPELGCIDELLEKKRLQHPSHCHPLTLMRKPAFSFHCDGCGTDDQDMAYTCSACDFWIHKTCASLPHTLPTNHHRHHLSLAFFFPIEHRKFVYKCDVCLNDFYMTYWVYYCGDCRYFAHVKCATSTVAPKDIIPAESSSSLTIEKYAGSDEVIELPVDDISKELITPFIVRARENNGLDKIPDAKDMPPSIVMPETAERFSLLFNYHKHPLSLVWEGPIDELTICDVCVTPIYSPPYYNCATCNKYFLHSTCYFLPKTLCLDPLQLGKCRSTMQNHILTAYSSSELDKTGILMCWFCQYGTNGMVYKCEDCKLSIDVKCASLPIIIKHASHPQHKLIMIPIPIEERGKTRCGGCGGDFNDASLLAYYCTRNDCDFALEFDCVFLPKSIKHQWDRHPLQLTYDASVDHPTDFYCEICEEEMHPKIWMYHCRECDHSFEPFCLTGSNFLRNFKFGREFEFGDRLHPHPLTFKQTHKVKCDSCHKRWSTTPGFECESCNYAVCSECGITELVKMY